MNRKRQLIAFVSFMLVLFGSLKINCLPAAALLREHHESLGVIRYHAQSSLKDKQGYTWQVVLFPESVSDNEVTKYHLRLVGFPGIAEFIHPQPLEITTAKGRVLNATELITVSFPAPNVGEFDLTNVLPILPDKGSLKLSTILRGDRDLSLSIPESTLIEWQWLALTERKLN
jgi:hypothetical protein